MDAKERPADVGVESQLIGTSSAFEEVLARLCRFSACDAPVLVEGETGTGKELIARAVHYRSERAGGPFVPVNCAALPEALVVNELFGHEVGAYTGAQGRQSGLVDKARGGTIFFDEVDSLPIPAQAVLLRFLQDQEFRPLGAGSTQRGDVRVVAATNTRLTTLVRTGRFREDLFYRLNVLSIVLPPLRARLEDVPLLAEHFLRRLNQQYPGNGRTLTRRAKTALEQHPWPGNVRELENRLHRAYLLASGAVIEADDLDLGPAVAARDTAPRTGTPCGFADAKARVVEEFERDYLRRLMATAEGNVSAASRMASKERRAFTRLLKKHGINRQQFLPRGG